MSTDPRLLKAINELRLAVGGVANAATADSFAVRTEFLRRVDHHLHQVCEALDELEEA